MARKKIPTPAARALLKMVAEILPGLEPREADLQLRMSYDSEGEGDWSITGGADADAASLIAGAPSMTAAVAFQRAFKLDREGDAILLVRYR